MERYQARPIKLRNGDWGLAGDGDAPPPGAVVLVRTKQGKEWLATVGRVLWKGTTKRGQGWIATDYDKDYDRQHGKGRQRGYGGGDAFDDECPVCGATYPQGGYCPNCHG